MVSGRFSMIYYSPSVNKNTFFGGINMSIKTMKVLIVELEKAPYAADIPARLESLQKQVGRLIQALYRTDVAIICNNVGKLIGLPWNRPLFDEDENLYDIIAGTFLVVGLFRIPDG